ncbi:MAG: ABC transporter ATP-binding protein/permease [Lachnospiraceae bacterium]|nr:ABC transporter ATP-binding protein/permease [Lachnospiraceae bacterium]
MKQLLRYMLKYWYLYLLAGGSLILGVVMDVASPLITERIVDDVIIGGKRELMVWLLILLLGLGIGKGIFKYLEEFIGDVIGVSVGRDIRRDLFDHIEKMSVDFFDQFGVGELMSRIGRDVDRVWDAAGYLGLLCAEAVVHTVFVIVCMLRISPVLTLIPVCIMPAVAWIAVRLEKKLDQGYDELSEITAELNTVAEENLAGVRTVKAFSREEYEMEKFRRHNGQYYDRNMAIDKAMADHDPAISFLTKLLLVFSVTVGGILVVNDKISLGQLSAFMGYANNIVWPMEILGWVTNALAAGLASMKKINKIMSESSQLPAAQNPVKPEKIEGHVCFSHVDFQVQDKQILSDISFDLPAGKTLGVMGMTGSGKTTLVQLLQRLYDVTGGAVFIDGMDIREMDLHTLRGCQALVAQDVFLFSDTVRDNIAIGRRKEMEQLEIIPAGQMADADEFIQRLPQKYETVIGERGVGLSGGQKQRISMARAFVRKAPILILDDATSALDMETERQVQRNLKQMEGMTKIIIAHRISSVRNADEILVLQDGRIAERGTHESLLAQKGRYYETWMAQYGEIST